LLAGLGVTAIISTTTSRKQAMKLALNEKFFGDKVLSNGRIPAIEVDRA
jgi:hypothetical protein